MRPCGRVLHIAQRTVLTHKDAHGGGDPLVAKLRIGRLGSATRRPRIRFSGDIIGARKPARRYICVQETSVSRGNYTIQGLEVPSLEYYVPEALAAEGMLRGEPRSTDTLPPGDIFRHIFGPRNAICVPVAVTGRWPRLCFIDDDDLQFRSFTTLHPRTRPLVMEFSVAVCCHLPEPVVRRCGDKSCAVDNGYRPGHRETNTATHFCPMKPDCPSSDIAGQR